MVDRRLLRTVARLHSGNGRVFGRHDAISAAARQWSVDCRGEDTGGGLPVPMGACRIRGVPNAAEP
ncbi:MAG: hypothetical protein WA948_10970 [Pontixanthobacter sp.]